MAFEKHTDLEPHHKYQLEVILLFVAGFFLFFPYYYLVEDVYQLNMEALQWYFFIPWITFYVFVSLRTRAKVTTREYIPARKRHTGYWILLGIALVWLQIENIALTPLYSLDIMYIVFSLFLADSYWDFRETKNS